MHAGALRALEFNRIVGRGHRSRRHPTGRGCLAELHPLTDTATVIAAQQATTEGTRFLEELPGFPLRAPGRARGDSRGARCGGKGARAASPARVVGLSRVDRAVARRGDQAAGAVSHPARARRTRRLLPRRDCRRAAEDRSGRRGGGPRKRGARQHPRTPAAPARQAADDARLVPARSRHVEIPAAAGHHRSQRALRADGAGGASVIDSRYRPRRLGERREPVRGAARDRRDQQRHRRTRGAGGGRSPPHPPGADRRVPCASLRLAPHDGRRDRAGRDPGAGAVLADDRRDRAGHLVGRQLRAARGAPPAADAQRGGAPRSRSGIRDPNRSRRIPATNPESRIPDSPSPSTSS